MKYLCLSLKGNSSLPLSLSLSLSLTLRTCACTCTSSPSSPLPLLVFSRTTKPATPCSPQLSFSTPRRSRRSRLPTRNRNYHNLTTDNNRNNLNLNLRRTIELETSLDSPNLKLVLDFHRISSLSSSTLDHLLSSSADALQDLRTLVRVDPHTRALELSCRKSTLQFLAALFTCGFLLLSAFRVLVWLASGLKARFRPKPKVIVRRDRSLGGREVIVGTTPDDPHPHPPPTFRALDNPLSLSSSSSSSTPRPNPVAHNNNYPGHQVRPRVGNGEKLPKWWPAPASVSKQASSDYYQIQANTLIRAIIDNRLGGKDISEDDITQLRQICRTSGVRVSIDTANTRDSFYRASVELVLNVCCRAPSESTYVEIDGEDARQFLGGLAENIGLDNIRAARMVSAGVAARTRFCFLQAWAFEMQGKHTEALLELSKICLVHRIFPPQKSSPEMEMVARGLEKILKVEQRELLMGMLVGVCSGESRRSAAEALGLVC